MNSIYVSHTNDVTVDHQHNDQGVIFHNHWRISDVRESRSTDKHVSSRSMHKAPRILTFGLIIETAQASCNNRMMPHFLNIENK